MNGTTYAPLRALAKAYGLEVGYDSDQNIATGTKTSEAPAPASDFALAWEIKEKPVMNNGSEKIFTATYSGSLSMSKFKAWWKSFSADKIQRAAVSMKEITEYLGVSRDTVLDWTDQRGMPAAKIGRLWKFKISEVDAWMKSGVAAEQ